MGYAADLQKLFPELSRSDCLRKARDRSDLLYGGSAVRSGEVSKGDGIPGDPDGPKGRDGKQDRDASKVGVPYFRPSGPKRARHNVTVNDLRKVVADGIELTGYKNISIQPLVWLVYSAGDENYYVAGSPAFDKFVEERGLRGG